MALRNMFKFREAPGGEATKPFMEHLEDLRWTVVKMAIALAAAMALCLVFRSSLTHLIQAPLDVLGTNTPLRSLGITDSMTISFSLAFYAGIVVAFPVLLYFAAEFVLPALTALEKRVVLPGVLVSFLLFAAGVLFCYHFLLPKTIAFFFHDARSLGWIPEWTVREYYSFVTRFTIGFGLAFELPVVVLAMVRLGVISHALMARTRPYAIVLIVILAALITPTPDVLTLMAMAIPMYFLYESCIWIAWFMRPRLVPAADRKEDAP